MTQEEFNQDYGRIAMPKPFAHGGLITPIADIGDSTHPVNFEDGFPSQYSAPHSQGGKYVTRGEFNAIGNLATRNDFYKACGGLNTFNAALASKIKGYPKGAVLQLLDNNVLKYVISLVDNNTVNFNTAGVDGVNWMFCYESKHEEAGEGLLEHIELTDISSNTTSSTNVFVKKVPRAGFINIRNVNFEMNYIQVGNPTPILHNFFLGGGIICKSTDDPTTIIPCYSTDSAFPGWVNSRTLFTGDVAENWTNGTYVVSDFFGAFQKPDTKITILPGAVAVTEGEYVIVDIINGLLSSQKITSASTHSYTFGNIKHISFDIYLI